ncbi:MAG: hypothetical protein HZB26_04845 [Candidatus Hydrogenedentes bacterium]|nr:hypothetical protein [Candidatus Hydrogenedentota bacterium]
MLRSEKIFLCVVLAFALAFAGITLQAVPGSESNGATAVRTGAGGQSRDVDMVKLERLMREQSLSDHEAQFYRRTESREAPPNPRAPVNPRETTGADAQ